MKKLLYPLIPIGENIPLCKLRKVCATFLFENTVITRIVDGEGKTIHVYSKKKYNRELSAVESIWRV